MFYLILLMMLVLFYLFAAPRNIKGTMNVVIAVFLLVGFVIALTLMALKVVQSPPELWLGLFLVLLGIWCLYDIGQMDRRPTPPTQVPKRPYSRRYK